jgi:hypothetical protein
MSDYDLVSTGRGRRPSPEALTATLAEAFPGTEFEHDLIPEAPVSLWAYVPDGDGHTGEVTFTDTTRECAAQVTAETETEELLSAEG